MSTSLWHQLYKHVWSLFNAVTEEGEIVIVGVIQLWRVNFMLFIFMPPFTKLLNFWEQQYIAWQGVRYLLWAQKQWWSVHSPRIHTKTWRTYKDANVNRAQCDSAVMLLWHITLLRWLIRQRMRLFCSHQNSLCLWERTTCWVTRWLRLTTEGAWTLK